MIAEDRIAGLLIRVARGGQIVEEEPISVRVIVLVVAEAIPRLYSPMTATIVDQIAGQQDDVRVTLRVVVDPDEASIPVVVGIRLPSVWIVPVLVEGKDGGFATSGEFLCHV